MPTQDRVAMDSGRQPEVPKIIWSFWEGGFSEAPPLVQLCVATWSKYSGIEDIRLLDMDSISQYLKPRDLPRTFKSLPVQMKSDAIRLAVLARHGGVWLDASTLVTAPVDQFLRDAVRDAGLFLFQNGKNGKGGRWFEIGVLAATPRNPFVSRWSASFNRFFSRDKIHYAHSPSGPAPRLVKIVFGLLNRVLRKSPLRSALWVRFPLRLLPFYPYFVTYYLANRLLMARSFSRTLRQMKFEPVNDYLWFRNELNHGRGLTAAGQLRELGRVFSDLEFRIDVTDKDLQSLYARVGLSLPEM